MTNNKFQFAPYQFRLVNSIDNKKIITVDKNLCTDQYYAVQLGLIKFYAIRLSDVPHKSGCVLDWVYPSTSEVHQLKFTSVRTIRKSNVEIVWVVAK